MTRRISNYDLRVSLNLQVMGVITRKDIAEANAKLALGRKANLGLTTPSERLVRHGTLPFIPYGAYDPTVGYSSSRQATHNACTARNVEESFQRGFRPW